MYSRVIIATFGSLLRINLSLPFVFLADAVYRNKFKCAVSTHKQHKSVYFYCYLQIDQGEEN